MLEHFKDYNDIVGDHPQNLSATTLALNAYMLTHDRKYKDWLLEYVDAWRQRMADNGGIIPSNIGLDGKIGGASRRQVVRRRLRLGLLGDRPGHRADRPTGTRVHLGLIGFGNAYFLTGDDRYLDPWRKQIDLVNAQKKIVDGREMYPHMHGDQGWYAYSPRKYDDGRPGALVLVDEARGPPAGARRPPGWLISKARTPATPSGRSAPTSGRSAGRSPACAATRRPPTPGSPTTRWSSTRRPSARWSS